MRRSQKLGATNISSLQALASGGVGGQITLKGEGNNTLTITYNGNGDFTVVNSVLGDSATFHLEGVVAASGAGATTQPLTTTLQLYVVQRGDTLTKIARRFGVSVNALILANKLKEANVIFIGQRLIIPGK